MKPNARELWWSLAAIIAITLLYLAAVRQLQGVPAASGLLGHSIGVIGFMLMLATETLYSIRKRSRRASWGRPATWLRVHIFTGLVGSYMVLLHSSFKFNGLAGLAMLMTVVVVISGFIGRYIYTAVPRNADGLMLEAADLQTQIAMAEAELRRALASQPATTQALAAQFAAPPTTTAGPAMLVLGRPLLRWRQRRQWRSALRHLDPAARAQASQMEALVARRQGLQRQAASLATARRLLGVWHSVHIPLGVALFTVAFIHILAALYFATLLH
jgi:hypothetical protein